jgi:hypothetical protein
MGAMREVHQGQVTVFIVHVHMYIGKLYKNFAAF